MTSSQTDLRALQRGPRSSNLSPTPSTVSNAEVVPRPGARWATRLLIPAAVLLATGSILAYAAREVLQTRLEVYVAAVIPKAGDVGFPRDNASQATATPANNSAETRLGPVAVQAPGWIEPAPFAVSVPALTEGVVREVLVLEGEHVEAGQVVVSLIDDDARLLLRGAEAAVTQRDADVSRARAALATAESQVKVERISVDELRDDVTRKRDLVAAGSVSAGEFRRMEIRLGGLEAKVATAEHVVGESQAALAQVEAARASSLVAKDEALLRLARMDVRSPLAGVVLARLVEPGSRISMGGKGGEGAVANGMSGAVLRIYDPLRLQVRVDVPLADAAKVGIGTRAVVSTEALPDQTFTGVVTRVVHEANIQRNTVQFKVAIDAPSPVLKPEMLTRVKLHATATVSQTPSGATTSAGTSNDALQGELMLLVPAGSVTPAGEGKAHIWVVDASGGSPVARWREIATVPSAEEGFLGATSGLRLTDRVILDPPAPPAIQDGTRLKILGERTTAASLPASPTP